MKFKDILFAIFIYIIFPFSSVFMKLASSNSNMAMKLFLFCCSIGVLAIFSILWQMLLKKVDLTKAYLFKSTTIIWNVFYGILIFEEKITFMMVLGMIITTIGVMITIVGDKQDAK